MNVNKELSKNFVLREFLNSSTAIKNNINEQLSPPETVVDNLQDLTTNVLQPLREAMGFSISINSGYRCDRLNKLVGGSSTSEHCKGTAADIDTNNFERNLQMFNWIKANCNFRQLIIEDVKKGYIGWVHVSYDKNDNKKQILIKKHGIKGYLPFSEKVLNDLIR